MSDKLVSALVTDLKTALKGVDDPADAIARVTPLVKKMAEDTSWVKPEYYKSDDEQGFGINILNEEPDNTLLVEVICWAPGRGVAPHDHQTWGVVVGIDGTEVNVDWRRKDDGATPGFADLEMASETDITNGVVCTLMPDDIHGVRNDGDVPSVSLHVYGKVLASLNRSEFDAINKTQKPCPQRKRTMANA